MALKVVLLLAVIAQAAGRPTLALAKLKEVRDQDVAAATGAKADAVKKVIEMMESLQKQVMAEGEKEAATYDKFACFCESMTKEKSAAIMKEKDEIAETSGTIKMLSIRDGKLVEKIAKENKDIKDSAKSKAQLMHENQVGERTYLKNSADLSAAIDGVKQAIRVLKASKSSSFVQLQSVSQTVSTALLLADALGLSSSEDAGLMFLQGAPSVPVSTFNFHSEGIIASLEKLQDEFRAKKNEVDAEEQKRVQAYTMAMQRNKKFTQRKTGQLSSDTGAEQDVVAGTAEAKQDLEVETNLLAGDREYLASVSADCAAKAKTWDERSKMREQELTAITQAIDIVKNTVAQKVGGSKKGLAQLESHLHIADAVANDEETMMALEAEAEDTDAVVKQTGTLSFLQRHQTVVSNPDAKQSVVSLLKQKGMKLKSSALLNLALHISADPFTKIKQLIQDMIEKQIQEQANEASQKGWCDKALSDAEQKRDLAAEKVEDLNGKIATLTSKKDALIEAIAVLEKEMAELTASGEKAKKLRSEEAFENAESIDEAKEGLEATQTAMKILNAFYSKANAAATKKAGSLLSDDSSVEQVPDPGFATGEAYAGKANSAGGIVGMLEVISGDFQHTIDKTTAEEDAAKKEFAKFEIQNEKSLAEKRVAKAENSKYKDETEENLDTAQESLQAQSGILSGAIKELIQLKAKCIDTGMSYKERDAQRQEEIDALKKAITLLE